MSRSGSSLAARALCAAIVLVAGVATAQAKCARLAFTVNDYGKEGPTRDAKALLDKHIASWTAARGITRFTTGKKDVTCELFLDFGVFDEHTCKASATVCWPDGQGGAPVKVKADPAAKADPAPAKVEAPKKGGSATAKPIVAPIQVQPSAPKADPAEAPAAPAPAKVKPKAV